ncbi:MAG TPA: hypothetical protein PLA50_14650 [Bacteroidia bacterium]|nr:hypothetical protein [Bacteroidia bacterium]
MKSAYERAMERFGQSEPVQTLTDGQKAELAALSDKYKAKIAERELFLNDLMARAIAEGRYHEVPELKTQLARETAALNAECEAAKEKVRQAAKG